MTDMASETEPRSRPTALRAVGLSKAYGDATVLEGFTAELRAGEVVALMGANGAGKSTAGKILAGAIAPSGGELFKDGTPVPLGNRRDAMRAGLEFVPQELDLCADLKVWENIALADERMRRFRVALSPARARRRTRELLTRVGAGNISVEARVNVLSFAERQLVAIARALASDPEYIVFDEPTASLGRDEAAEVTRLVRRLAAEGVGCAFISHRIHEILETCDHAIVLRDGRITATGAIEDFTADTLEEAMFASYETAITAHRETNRTPTRALSIREASRRGAFEGVDLEVQTGEIVGVYGLAGSGISSLLRCASGAEPLHKGQVVRSRSGVEHNIVSLRSARDQRIGFVSMDRSGEGIFPRHSCAENIESEQISRRFLITDRQLMKEALKDGAAAGLGSGRSLYERNADDMSGGQQQKALIARRMAGGSDCWVLDEPLGGIDTKTKRELASLFHQRASRGDSFLVATGDLSDIIALCDRALVMHGGRLIGSVDAVDEGGSVVWDDEKLNRLRALAVRPLPPGAEVRPTGTEQMEERL